MPVFKAYVQDGRLVLDEPTDLPENEVVYLQTIDATDLADGSMSADEREDLFQALDEAIESVRPPEDDEADEPVGGGEPASARAPESSPATPQS
jgi:hypothetical protein